MHVVCKNMISALVKAGKGLEGWLGRRERGCD